MKSFHAIIFACCMLATREIVAQEQALPSIAWKIAGALPSSSSVQSSIGVAGPVCGAFGDKIFVAGGANFPNGMPWQGGSKMYYSNITVFTRNNDSILAVHGEFSLPEQIAYAANCSTPKGVLYAGGENENGASDKVFLLSWNSAKNDVVIDSLPSLPLAICNAAATAYGNLVFVAGGETREGVSKKCWSFDLDNLTSGWKEVASIPKPVSHAVLVAAGNADGLKLFLVGGRRKRENGISEIFNTVYELDVVQNQWKNLPALPYAISAGTGVLVNSVGIVLFGGDRGNTFNKVESYLVAISKEKNEAKKKNLTQEKNNVLASHPGFSKEIIFYNFHTGKSYTIGSIPFATPVTTNAFWWDEVVIIPSGEIRAGVRTPNILMAKINCSVK